jgi:sigma-B regulation protein RsbU (phosphoserine phosphatase)
LDYTNAGHNPPILLRRDGSHVRLEHGGTALGVVPEARYEQGSVDLQRGDRLVLFTDGVTEAESLLDVEFGEERLLSLLRESRYMSAMDLQMAIIKAVNNFSGGTLRDDATLIVVAVD